MAKVDGPCECVILDGHLEAGETAPCPEADHDHVLREVFHTEVVTNLRILG
jgi:hypothetical protein